MREIRKISGLRSVDFSSRSFPEPKGKDLNSAQKAGKTFERKVIKEIQKRLKGNGIKFFPAEWLEFYDSAGFGMAQPDIFLTLPNGSLVIVEVKLTQKDLAWEQLEGLYAPLLRQLFSPRKIFLIQAFKRLKDPRKIKFIEIEDMLNLSNPKQRYALHEPFL